MSNMRRKFDIETPDYEQERHVFDMCLWINEKLVQMEQQEGFATIYLERKGENIKKLIEEAMPTACLGLYFFRPADNVYIQCLAGNQPFDAKLRVTGFHRFEIKVEVTTLETEDSVLRRQSLSRTGFTWRAGPIKRQGHDIVSEPGWENIVEREEAWVDLAFHRALEKLKYNQYGRDTAILVNLDTHRPLALESRADLIRRTFLHIQEEKPEIYGVFYCYAGEFVVDGVRSGELI